MRSAELRPDGTLQISRIDRTLKDLDRYMRHRAGMSFIDIAREEGIDPKVAEYSVRRGGRMFEAEQQLRLRDAKYEGAIENEKIRTDVRKRIATQLVDSIETLLAGKRTVVEVNKDTGEVTMHEITDPEIIALGVRAALKTISLEEKAGPSMVLNLQQNMIVDGSGEPAAGASYEERLERIQIAQSQAKVPASREIIDVSASDATPVEAELVDDEEEELF